MSGDILISGILIASLYCSTKGFYINTATYPYEGAHTQT